MFWHVSFENEPGEWLCSRRFRWLKKRILAHKGVMMNYWCTASSLEDSPGSQRCFCSVNGNIAEKMSLLFCRENDTLVFVKSWRLMSIWRPFVLLLRQGWQRRSVLLERKFHGLPDAVATAYIGCNAELCSDNGRFRARSLLFAGACTVDFKIIAV